MAAMQSQHKGRRTIPAEKFSPDGNASGTVTKQRGRTGRGACGDLPLSSLESDVGLAGPVGVDSDTDGGGGAATREEGT